MEHREAKQREMWCFQAGVQHIILAVSYRAELLESEMRAEEKKVDAVHKTVQTMR